MTYACSVCGASRDAPDGGLPDGWSLATTERGLERVCRECTRTNLRSIEAKLPEEWWE